MPATTGAIRAGRAYVEAFLDGTKLEKGLGKITDKLKRFSRSLGAIGGSLLGFAAVRLAPLVTSIKTFADSGDKLDKMSTRLGESVENLSALKFAAGQSGVEFDDLIGSLEELNIRLGETIRDGTGPASEAFKNLGLDAQKLAQMSPAERFKRIAQALSQIQSESRRGFLADEIFGGDAFKILPLLQQGQVGIEKLMRRAEELGIVLSEDDAKAAAEMTDALDELWQSIKAIGVTIAKALLPEALNFTEFVRDTIPEIREWIGENKDWIVSIAKTGAAMAAAGAVMVGLSFTINTFTSVLGGARALVKLFGGSLATLGPIAIAAFAVTAIIAYYRHLYKASDAVKELNRNLERSAELNDQLLERWDEKTKGVIESLKEVEGLEQRRKLLAEAIRAEEKHAQSKSINLQTERERLRNATSGIGPGFRDLLGMNANAQEIRATIKELEEQLKQRRKNIDALKEQQAFIKQNAGMTKEESEEVGKILEKLTDELENFGLTAAEKTMKTLRELTDNEEKLAEARGKLNELADKREEARLAEVEKKNMESVREILLDLKDDIDVLKQKPGDRERFKLLRELQRLGANPSQLESAKKLFDAREALQREPEPFSGQGGTFSSLAPLIFRTAKDDREKQIAEATQETAQNTRKIAKQKNAQTVTP